MILGKNSSKRELLVLEAIGSYELENEEDKCPSFYIDKILSEEHEIRLWPEQIWLIASDLSEYGFIKIYSDRQSKGWDRYEITEKGLSYLGK